MADARALTLQGGQFQQVADGDALYVGDEILRSPGAALSDFNLLTGSNTGTIYIGRTGQTVIFNGNLSVSGTMSFADLHLTGDLQVDGDTTLGDGAGDTIALNGLVNTDLVFASAASRMLYVATPSAPGVGSDLYVRSASGNGSNNAAGALVLDTGVPAGSGGAEIDIGLANARSINIAKAGVLTDIFGSLQVDEDLTALGDVVLGTATSDTITLTGRVNTDIAWQSTTVGGGVWRLAVDDSTVGDGDGIGLFPGNALAASNGNGGPVGIIAGSSEGTGTAGLIALYGGAANGTGVGGDITLTAGTGVGGPGGVSTMSGGVGGNGDGGNANVYGGTSSSGGSGGSCNVLAGGAGVGQVGGNVRIDAGPGGSGDGTITIGTFTASSITIGNNTSDLTLNTDALDIQLGGTSVLQGSGSTLTLQTGATFDMTNGTVDLPLGFSIDGTATSSNFTGTNASTLVDGGSADGLHTHTGGGGGGSTTDLTTHKTGEAINKGAAVVLQWDAGSSESRVYNACADSTDVLPYVLGISTATYGSAGTAATIRMLGETDVPASQWVNAPTATTDVGMPVYLSDQTGANKGKLALEADIPTGSGDYIVRVGYVSLHSISSADAKVVVMKHEETKKS